jgi:DNA repair protein RecN (Recombination protein N)
MLVELAVRDLGVIAELSLVLPAGTTAVTGETGAGKTLVVTAIELLMGGRADAGVVRPGASEARVEGRFVHGEEEVVLARVIPAEGRSRAYVDGRLAPVAALAEHGAALVDLHGQHAHQSLLSPSTQRAALDRFAGVDLGPLQAARRRVAELDAALAALGGDPRERARAVDLLRHQVAELGRARVEDPEEDERLAAEEDLLADAVAHQLASGAAHEALTAEEGAVDGVRSALAAVSGRAPFATVEARLRSLAAELDDVAGEVRAVGEGISDDPERIEVVRQRRALLHDLRRKYGDSLEEVMAFERTAQQDLADLESHDARASALDAERAQALVALDEAAARVGAARRGGAAAMAAAVEANLRELAMPRAVVAVEVGEEDPGDEVTFLLGANPGERTLPLAKVASGGELARAMLALRLVLLDREAGAGARTLVFDEVDAGIGGEAALAVGRSLAALGAEHQVLVVTHLPQVAAFADAQVRVTKEVTAGRTVAAVAELDRGGRVVELSRMLSGQPASSTARDHAEELLAAATASRRERRT